MNGEKLSSKEFADSLNEVVGDRGIFLSTDLEATFEFAKSTLEKANTAKFESEGFTRKMLILCLLRLSQLMFERKRFASVRDALSELLLTIHQKINTLEVDSTLLKNTCILYNKPLLNLYLHY